MLEFDDPRLRDKLQELRKNRKAPRGYSQFMDQFFIPLLGKIGLVVEVDRVKNGYDLRVRYP